MTETEVVVIGAGPAGLYQAFQLGLLGLHAEVIDALPHVGGQVIELYGDKPIYDIPAVPVCTGRELVDRLLDQLRPLQPGWHLGHPVQTLAPAPDGRWQVGTAEGARFLAKAVVIAAGVGAFEPRRLKLDGIEAFEGSQVFHRRQAVWAFAGQQQVIIGGDEAALAHAIATAEAHGVSHPVTLIHRRHAFQAPAALIERFDALCEEGLLRFIAGQPTRLVIDDHRLTAIELIAPEGQTVTVPLDVLHVMLGLSPKLGPVTEWGLALERKQLIIDPASGATSASGIYAIGDVVHYPGKKRLIACAFHEATMTAHAVLAQLHPDRSGPLLYTSSSTLLQERLGVVSPPQRS